MVQLTMLLHTKCSCQAFATTSMKILVHDTVLGSQDEAYKGREVPKAAPLIEAARLLRLTGDRPRLA